MRDQSERDQLLAKIKKCLALSKSANEHEAAAALAKARQLMDDYGVDQSDVDMADVGEFRAKGGGAWTPAQWETYLVFTVRRVIPCHVLSCGDEGWRFVGITPAPEIAGYAFGSLFRQLKRDRANYIKTALKRVKSARRKTARADAYAEGWVIAVMRKIQAIYPKQELDDLVNQYLAIRYPDRSTFTPRASAADDSTSWKDRDSGIAAGAQARLHAGVSGAEKAALLA